MCAVQPYGAALGCVGRVRLPADPATALGRPEERRTLDRGAALHAQVVTENTRETAMSTYRKGNSAYAKAPDTKGVSWLPACWLRGAAESAALLSGAGKMPALRTSSKQPELRGDANL